jgi:hypothetical protein
MKDNSLPPVMPHFIGATFESNPMDALRGPRIILGSLIFFGRDPLGYKRLVF